jgi:hypothetical protein
MYGERMRRFAAGRPGLLVFLVVLTIGALLVTGLGACGDSGDEGAGTEEVSVTGAYGFDSGTEEGMEEFTLTLNDDDTFALTQPDPEGGEDVGINGTYALEGDKITLTASDSEETEVGTVEGDKLVFETITWVKQ